MSFATDVKKSVYDSRILVELDIGQLNVQWVNNGAGLWSVNALNLYDWVDSTLVEEGFSAQNFGPIGSVHRDGYQLIEVDTLGAVTLTKETFYYDKDDKMLTIHLINHDEPSLHAIWIGVIYGYSFDEYTPVGSEYPVEGRLSGAPHVGISRDPLYYGKIAFDGGGISIVNADGELDDFAQNNDIYGNPVRVYLGYDGLDESNYQQLYTGYIENINIGEELVSVSVSDRRKQLTRAISYNSTSVNAFTTIKNILTTYFSVTYDENFFDTTAWAAAVASSETVTINMQADDDPIPAIDLIEKICQSVEGLFIILPDGRYSAKLVDTSASAETTIFAGDIMSQSAITYNPTEVVSSIRIGYNRDWATSSDQYTYYTDDSAEMSVYTQYKTYKELSIDTYLENLTAATALGTVLLNRHRYVKGEITVEVPMKYYERAIGDIVDVEIERPAKTMIGTTKSEIISIGYNLDRPTMHVGVRFV